MASMKAEPKETQTVEMMAAATDVKKVDSTAFLKELMKAGL